MPDDSTVRLNWLASQNADEYLIFRYDGNIWQQVGNVSTTSFEDTGLAPGQNYGYTIVAKNGESDTLSTASETSNVELTPGYSVVYDDRYASSIYRVLIPVVRVWNCSTLPNCSSKVNILITNSLGIFLTARHHV